MKKDIMWNKMFYVIVTWLLKNACAVKAYNTSPATELQFDNVCRNAPQAIKFVHDTIHVSYIV